jgi:filamentous hemagglutinin family protein
MQGRLPLFMVSFLGLAVLNSSGVQAQIVQTLPGELGATGTIVTPTATQIEITGGQVAGTNQFHSFSQFNVTTDQIANFQSAAGVQNILASVNGGNPSIINGMLRLSGDATNLYLMNPAGIIFGPNASFNIPGSFVGTTATSIGLRNSGQDVTAAPSLEFKALGDNIYANLKGTPQSFNFSSGATGSIFNYSSLINRASNSTNKTGLILVANTIASVQPEQESSTEVAMATVQPGNKTTIGSEGFVLSPIVDSQETIQFAIQTQTELLNRVLPPDTGGDPTYVRNALGWARFTANLGDMQIFKGSAVFLDKTSTSGTTARIKLNVGDLVLFRPPLPGEVEIPKDTISGVPPYVPVSSVSFTLPSSILNPKTSQQPALFIPPPPPPISVISPQIPISTVRIESGFSKPITSVLAPSNSIIESPKPFITLLPSALIPSLDDIIISDSKKWLIPSKIISTGILKVELDSNQEGVLTRKVTR